MNGLPTIGVAVQARIELSAVCTIMERCLAQVAVCMDRARDADQRGASDDVIIEYEMALAYADAALTVSNRRIEAVNDMLECDQIGQRSCSVCNGGGWVSDPPNDAEPCPSCAVEYQDEC